MTESARIASLETQVRTLKRMLFGVFGVVVAGAVLGATSLQTVPGVIKAKRFEVVNDQGKVLVELGSLFSRGSHYGFATTSSSKGGALVKLGVTVNGEGMVTTENGKGATLVEIGVIGNIGSVTTENGKGGTLVELAATDAGEGAIQTQNGRGGQLVEITASVAGEGMVTTENGKGGELVLIGAGNGVGKVITQNGKGGRLVLIGAVDGAGAIGTLNEKGEVTSLTPEP